MWSSIGPGLTEVLGTELSADEEDERAVSRRQLDARWIEDPMSNDSLSLVESTTRVVLDGAALSCACPLGLRSVVLVFVKADESLPERQRVPSHDGEGQSDDLLVLLRALARPDFGRATLVGAPTKSPVVFRLPISPM